MRYTNGYGISGLGATVASYEEAWKVIKGHCDRYVALKSTCDKSALCPHYAIKNNDVLWAANDVQNRVQCQCIQCGGVKQKNTTPMAKSKSSMFRM